MASVVLDANQTSIQQVVWDWSRLLNETGAAAYVISGRSLREYSFPLNEEIRRRGGIVIEDANDVQAAFRRVIPATGSSWAPSLLQPVPDRIVGRFEVARRKHDLSNWSISEYYSRLLFDDPIFPDVASLQAAVEQASQAFDGHIVSYNHHTSHLSYFRLILPLIAGSTSSARWIIIATDRVEDSSLFTRVDRDYLQRRDLIEALCKIARLDPASIESIIAEHASKDRSVRELHTDDMTRGEFESALLGYRAVVLPKVGQYVPLVPSPDSAPIEFGIHSGQIRLLDESLPQKIQKDVLQTVLRELIEQLDDVSRHFNLHNSAPACSTKLNRVRDRLIDLQEQGLTESRVIALGISTHAARDHLAFERDNIESAAEGAIVSGVAQVDLFLNRFRAWRAYLQDSAVEAPEPPETEAMSAAGAIMASVAAREAAVDEGARFALRRAAYEAESTATSVVEKRGVLRVVHNLVANVFAFLRDQAREPAKAARGTVETFWEMIVSVEGSLRMLADRYPLMFGWCWHLMKWLRAMRKETT